MQKINAFSTQNSVFNVNTMEEIELKAKRERKFPESDKAICERSNCLKSISISYPIDLEG